MDEELYKRYISGDKDAFEKIYEKYQNRIIYFVFRIVKDYSKAEEITQDVFLYLLNNKFDESVGSLKSYIYLIAKSKALNYLKNEKRRNEINQNNLYYEEEIYEKDILEKIIEKESQREVLKSIEMINEKYREALYLSKIEGLSYKEIAKALDISIYNVKNYIYRGNKELKNILTKKGYKIIIKNIIVFLVIIIFFSGFAYAVTKIYEKHKVNNQNIPTYLENVGENNMNKLWIGTFQLVWNEYSNNVISNKIEFEDGESILVDELNKQLFDVTMISESDYYIKVGITSEDLKKEIIHDINDKFGISKIPILNEISFKNEQNQKIYTLFALLFKKFNFIHPFDQLYPEQFSDDKMVKYFGINNASSEELNENVKILFYNNDKDFAVSLKTKENEEIIMYCNDDNKTFNELYNEIYKKESMYLENKNFSKNDEIKIPYITLDTTINYGELCGRAIKNTNIYISSAIQKVMFELNERGGNLKSEAALKDAYLSANDGSRYFYFNRPFVLFLKEADKQTPYFALKIEDTELLVEE